MSKRIFIFIIVGCILVSASVVFAYKKKFSDTSQNIKITSRTIEKMSIKKSVSPKSIPIISEQNGNALVPNTSTFSLLAFGDIMLDRSVFLKTQAAKNWEHPFLLIDPLLQEYDLHLANLEGPITTNKSVANGTGGARFTFTFSPNFVEPLKKRFEFLSLANNHSYNFGKKGLEQTREYLSRVGVKYFGGPDNIPGNIFVTSSYNGITFGFIGYHQLVEKGFENILVEAKKLDNQVDVLIAMPHWGVEYDTKKPSYLQIKEAHEMIDAGVDLIIGAHPHVIQPIEIYKDKVIFYSLGNFIFDQYFSEETMTGLAIGMNIEKVNNVMKFQYKLIPLDINIQSQPSEAGSLKKEKILKHLTTFSIAQALKKEEIKNGNMTSQYTLSY